MRGYDDSASWSLDYYLAAWLPDVLRRIKQHGGIPTGLTLEQWHARLDEMILAFELIRSDDWTPDNYDDQQRKIRTGLVSFALWFQDLWT